MQSEFSEPHILVVDDDRRIRQLLQRFLIENGFRVTAAEDTAKARSFLEGLAFDLLILDIMMPGETGLEFTEYLRQNSDVPILLLTARGEPQDRIEGLELGADDYLGKPFEPKELLLRIKSILRRTHVDLLEQPSELRLGQCRFNLTRGELTREGKQVKLTSGENALLKLLGQNPGETFSRLDLCERLGIPQERSIDVQITRLRRKIEQDPKMPIYLQTVRGVGYVLMPD